MFSAILLKFESPCDKKEDVILINLMTSGELSSKKGCKNLLK